MPYWQRRDELSVEDSCLLWGRRVVIPDNLQKDILTELHECHPGMCRMKALARSYVWWPTIDEDIEDKVRQCGICIHNQVTPKSVPLLLWPWATEPWQRIHIEFLEIRGQQFLLIVDSHSKWMEVFPMTSTTVSATVNILLCLFARYGFPKEVVSDNGPQFTAVEFGAFLKERGIKHTLCPPYHPSSNGLAERHVQTFKSMFNKYEGSQCLPLKISEILFHYRNTPSSTTGKSPAELFLKRSPRIRLSLIKPCLQSKIETKQGAAKLHHDGNCPVVRKYDVYQRVLVRNKRGGKEKWMPGTVVKVTGPSTYIVRMAGNIRRFVHADHITYDDSLENQHKGSGSSVNLYEKNAVSFENQHRPMESSVNLYEKNTVDLTSSEEGPPEIVSPPQECSNGIPSRDSIIRHSEGNTKKLASPIKVSRAGRPINHPQRLDL